MNSAAYRYLQLYSLYINISKTTDCFSILHKYKNINLNNYMTKFFPKRRHRAKFLISKSRHDQAFDK